MRVPNLRYRKLLAPFVVQASRCIHTRHGCDNTNESNMICRSQYLSTSFSHCMYPSKMSRHVCITHHQCIKPTHAGILVQAFDIACAHPNCISQAIVDNVELLFLPLYESSKRKEAPHLIIVATQASWKP